MSRLQTRIRLRSAVQRSCVLSNRDGADATLSTGSIVGPVIQPPIDLAIVGVPKAGTSSLYTWLAAHPDVQGSEPKETRYFIKRDSKLFVWNDIPEAETYDEDGWAGFERFFPEPREGRLRLEASPSNLYLDMPLRALTDLHPQPLVIIALRCPAEQIRSAFYFTQNNGSAGNFVDRNLTFPTYVEALLGGDLEPLKRAIPSEQLRWYLGEILDYNKYVEWLDRWEAKLPPEKLMTVRFDDIADRPRETLDAICKRAGIDAAFYDDYQFERINPTLARPSSRFRQLAHTVHRVLPEGRVHDLLAKTYRELPAGQYIGSPSADEAAAMVALGEYFALSNQALAARFGVDVSPWWPMRVTH